uniref:Putative ovule protein n=1 Tax=Solanum chacoense TaxID=4108 RepID=A0A0V0H0C8_SOLCH
MSQEMIEYSPLSLFPYITYGKRNTTYLEERRLVVRKRKEKGFTGNHIDSPTKSLCNNFQSERGGQNQQGIIA